MKKVLKRKNRHQNNYSSVLSVIWPTLQTYELPIPVFLVLYPSEEESIDEKQETDDVTQEILIDSYDPFYAKSELNELICNSGLYKNAAEILALLYKTIKDSHFWNRARVFMDLKKKE